MQILLMIYNMLLLVTFFVPIILSSICYIKNKNDIILAIILLFGIFSIDHIVICLTEFVPWFAEKYDTVFLGFPTWKTIAYLLTYGCMIFISKKVLTDCMFTIPSILLILMGVFQLFVPMMENTVTQVWLYYFSSSVYLFIFSAYVLIRIYKTPEIKTNPNYKLFLWATIITLIFPIGVECEDYFVIFNVDIYEQGNVFINNRNVTEDVEHIILTIITVIFLVRNLLDTYPEEDSLHKKIVEEEIKNLQMEEESVISNDTPLKNEIDLSKEFFKEYQLTEREQSIFMLILEDMSNQEISEKLLISLGTTKTHTHNIFSKLDVTKRKEAKDLYKAYIEK